MSINDFINSLSNELNKNNFHYIEISKDFNRFCVKSHNNLFLQCSQLTAELHGIEKYIFSTSLSKFLFILIV